MSKLDELIQQLCPDGVEYKPLGEVCILSRGKVYSKDYLKDNPGEFPVYSSQTANNGELGRINTYDCEGDYLTWTTDGAHAGTIFHRTGKFSITNVCGLIKIKEYNLYIRFLYYWLSIKAKGYVNQGMGNPKLMTNQIEVIPIPLPPLPVQEEIVRLLDLLTETTQKYQAELEAELDVRKKQYEEYRNQLLDLEGKEGVEMKMLGEVCDKTTNIKWKNISEEIVFKYIDLSSVNVENNSIESVSDINKTIAPSRTQQLVQTEDVILGTTRPTLKRFCVITESYNGQICSTGYCIYRAKKHIINFKWIYHNIGCTKFWDYCEAKQQGAGYPCLSNADAMAYKISIPPLTEQERIVNILDRMEKTHKELCQSIETEIRMRKQQYEYYRNQLLDFKKKKE